MLYCKILLLRWTTGMLWTGLVVWIGLRVGLRGKGRVFLKYKYSMYTICALYKIISLNVTTYPNH